jgi:hypothetical protein
MNVIARRKELDRGPLTVLELITLHLWTEFVVKMTAPFTGIVWIEWHIISPA